MFKALKNWWVNLWSDVNAKVAGVRKEVEVQIAKVEDHYYQVLVLVSQWKSDADARVKELEAKVEELQKKISG